MAAVQETNPEGFVDFGGDLDFSLGSDVWDLGLDLDLKYAFDVPPTPPASCLPTPMGSPRLTTAEDGSEGKTPTGVAAACVFDWSQAVMLEAFEEGTFACLGDLEATTPVLGGLLTPPRSPSTPVKVEPTSSMFYQVLVQSKEEAGVGAPATPASWLSLSEESEPEVAHINPSMITAPCTPVLAVPLALAAPFAAPVGRSEEEEDIDVETVDEHPFSDAQLLCLNQQLLLQQQQQALFPLPTTTFAPGVAAAADTTPLSTPFAYSPTTALAEATSSSSGDDETSFKRHRYTPYARPAGPKDPDHKRHTHNLLERRRREDLKSTFDMLSAVVPEVANDARVSKLQILQGATDQIRRLRDMGHHASAVRDALRNENAILMERIRLARANLQMKGVAPCV